MDKELEHVLSQAIQAGGGSAIEPGLANTLLREAQNAAHTQEQLGLPTVLLVPGQIRDLLARFLKRSLPQLKVISHEEVPGFKTVRVTSLVGGRA
jgi:flagellar biosynthesis protein FlhA